jgi:flagellar biosynthesis/type III secretory pathway M-ring protein FliF/YscJ
MANVTELVVYPTATPSTVIVTGTSPYWQWFESVFWVIILVIILIIVYVIIKEIRLMSNTRRLAEIDLEKEKLSLMKAEMAQRGLPFFRVSPEKLEEIRKLDEENVNLETDIFAKHNVVDKRIQRLEDKVKISKLDRLVERIKDEEKKIG